jgi:hypothetical protein
MDSISTDKLVETYVKIRDAKRETEKKLKDEVAEFDRQLDVIEAELLAICKEQDAEGIRTKHGFVSRRVKSRYWTADWEPFYNFVKEHDAFALLEKRIHQTNMKEFLEENPDLRPAGLNVDSEYTVVVTRSK